MFDLYNLLGWWPRPPYHFSLISPIILYSRFLASLLSFFSMNQSGGLLGLSLEELHQFQTLAQRLQQHLPSSADSSSTSGNGPTAGGAASINNPAIQPYHSLRIPANPPNLQGNGAPVSSLPSATLFPASQNGAPVSSLPSTTLFPASQGHPSSSTPTAVSLSQPFLGFNRLAVPMTSQANQQRLSAAAAHIPRQPRLPTRNTRRRGVAVAPPGLPRGPRVDDCYVAIGVGAEPGIRVKVKVYPPQVTVFFLLNLSHLSILTHMLGGEHSTSLRLPFCPGFL